MVTPLLLLVAMGTAQAETDPRIPYAREIVEEAGLPADQLDGDQAIATAVVLQKRDKAKGYIRRQGRKAEASGERLLYKVKVSEGRVAQISLAEPSEVDADTVKGIAEKLAKAKAGWDVSATVFVPVDL